MTQRKDKESPGTGLPDGAGPLLDRLIGCWLNWEKPENERYYLTKLAPALAQFGPSVLKNDPETEAALELQSLLSPELWSELPRLIAERREWQVLEAERESERADEAARQESLRAEREEAERQRRAAVLKGFDQLLEKDFLGAEEAIKADPDSSLLPPDELAERKALFVTRWAAEVLDQELDPDQANAVAATGGDLQITARAGSGKTRTLVTRALFLQKHCGVSPRSILLLAFNRRAAEELKERFGRFLAPGDLPHVMTFHALAHALVRPEEELIFDDLNSGRLGASEEVQKVIDEHLRSAEYRPMIRELMLEHYREDWERILEGRHERDMEEFLAHRRSLPGKSLRGDYVKSFGEKAIANALFENDVAYKYEQSHDWDGASYRPDFTLYEDKIIIEYFGLAGDPEYDKRSEEKREYWKNRKDWTLLEVFPADIYRDGRDGFARWLIQTVEALGASPNPLSEEEIWKRVKGRSIDSFSKAMANFIGRGRSQFPTKREFEEALDRHSSASRSEELFLEVGRSIFSSYVRRLDEGDKEDFNGLLHSAIAQVKQGVAVFSREGGQERGDLTKLEYVMVDEFQDFSPLFFRLISAIRGLNRTAELSCVGDDWQAINAFAGSDLRFFNDFSSYFKSPIWRSLQTNYRSPALVVKASNALMDGLGSPGEPGREMEGLVEVADLGQFRPTAVEKHLHKYDSDTPALLRLIRSSLDQGLSTVLLSRRNTPSLQIGSANVLQQGGRDLDQALFHLRSFLPEEDRESLSIATPHRFKGLEEQAVIVIDALVGSYPLIHPNWSFLRVFGESPTRIEEEERRLFYVALTRAQESLTLVTERGNESPFLGQIRRHIDLGSTQWDELSPVPPLEDGRLEIRVSGKGTYSVKESLKKYGFQWNGDAKHWEKSVPEEGFSLDALLSQPWKKRMVEVEVLDGAGTLRYVG